MNNILSHIFRKSGNSPIAKISRWLIFSVKLAIVVTGQVHAESAPDLDTLAANPTWKKLLHIPKGESKSEVQSGDFFLSNETPGDPRSELRAALLALQQPWDGPTDLHPRCRFPARYYWLSRHIHLPGYKLRDSRCRELEQWARIDELRSASLLLVSGYLGNPASSFGHALLRLNTSEPGNERSLTDLGFNFGALIPPSEPTPTYVWRGLTGGYLASFSDKYYYTHDLVYSRNELRDVWDYELDLNQQQLLMLVFHLYEIVGKKFTYYFLDKNCAWRLAQLIELVTEREMTDRSRLWYAPVELFHKLSREQPDGTKKLVRTVRYIPSNRRLVRESLRVLSDEERIFVFNSIGQFDPARSVEGIEHLPSESKIRVMDALVAHAQYLEMASEPTVHDNLRQRSATLLNARLGLPPTPISNRADPTPLPSPADNHRPMSFEIGIVSTGHGTRQATLRVTPFDYDELSPNQPSGSEVVVADTELRILGSHIWLNRIDFLRVRNLDPSPIGIPGESTSSWAVEIGLDREGIRPSDPLRARSELSYGLASEPEKGLVLYLLVRAGLRSDPGSLSAGPHFGIIMGQNSYKAKLESSIQREWASDTKIQVHQTRFEGRWYLSRDWSIGLEWQEKRPTKPRKMRSTISLLLSRSL